MIKIFALVVAAIPCVGGCTYGQPGPTSSMAEPVAPPGDATMHRHFGFFLRPDLGAGYMVTSEPTGTTSGDLTISGPAGVFGFAIGGAVAENVILAAHLYDGVVVSPNVSLSSGQSVTASNASLTMFGMGPEFTYYFMPANIYFSGMVALTRMSLTANGRDSSSNVGFGARLALGKEWWVGDHWGLGLVGHASSSWNKGHWWLLADVNLPGYTPSRFPRPTTRQAAS